MRRPLIKTIVALGSTLFILTLSLPVRGEESPSMTTYYLVMLMKGPNPSQSEAEAEELQKKHLEHLTELWQAGKTVIGGPFTDDGTIRGIVVYKVGSIEEARSLAEQDPAVKAGRLAVEVHPWMVQKGILP